MSWRSASDRGSPSPSATARPARTAATANLASTPHPRTAPVCRGRLGRHGSDRGDRWSQQSPGLTRQPPGRATHGPHGRAGRGICRPFLPAPTRGHRGSPGRATRARSHGTPCRHAVTLGARRASDLRPSCPSSHRESLIDLWSCLSTARPRLRGRGPDGQICVRGHHGSLRLRPERSSHSAAPPKPIMSGVATLRHTGFCCDPRAGVTNPRPHATRIGRSDGGSPGG
jgi:hypothetical protein